MMTENKRKAINLTPLYSLLLAFVVGAVLILLTGNNPIEIYTILMQGAFGSSRSIYQTLAQATPLIFAGIAVYFSSQAGILNLGVEGQLYMGALFSTIVAIYVEGLPSGIHILLSVAAGFIGGAIWAFIPMILKVKRGAHEVLTALMLNYVAILFTDFMLNYPLKDPNVEVPQTVRIAESATLLELFPKSNVTIALVIGVMLIVIVKLFFDRTKQGYQIKLVGANKFSAEANGLEINKIQLQTILVSGGIAGLLGTFEILGVYGRMMPGFSSGYGFEGIAVAALGSSPISLLFSALLFGGLKAGGIMLNFATNLSANFISTLIGLIIVIVSAPLIFTNLKKYLTKSKVIMKAGSKNA